MGSETAFQQDVHDVAAELKTHVGAGLSSAEARRRLQQHGPNAIEERGESGPLRLFASQFADVTILVLIGAAIISALIGDVKDAMVITGIVVLNAAIAFWQDLRAHHAIAALKKLGAGKATVVRDGERQLIPAEEVVAGDLVALDAGGIVPADLRLVEATQLRITESMLTGESVPVQKVSSALSGEPLALGDRLNMAFKGTSVAAGRGRGMAVATGMSTELGRLAELIEKAGEPRTPLQQRLNNFGRWLSVAIVAICAIVFIMGLMRGEQPSVMFLTAVSLAVAAIPEALPATLTIALALGARRMVEQRALVRRLVAVEALGSVTFICADKTGTLTQDRMHVEEVRTIDESLGTSSPDPNAAAWRQLLTALALNNDVTRRADGVLLGDPTETATTRLAAKAGLERDQLERAMPRVFELPFESERKRMTTVHACDGRFLIVTKGAPEVVIPRCSAEAGAEGEQDIDRQRALAAAGGMAARGMRVLAVAQRRLQHFRADATADAIESDLVLLGLVGLIDPPRPEAAESVAACSLAGITPIMITGDHPQTARAIAVSLGIANSKSEVVTGAELAEMSDEELHAGVDHIRIFARVDPGQKIRIVEALQAGGEFVAMTGDGVNDAPALRRANIGVAMGSSGTDAAREASDLILLDDNFASIVAAVREGRRIFDNIRKFLRFMLTGNSAEIWTIFLAPFLGLPIPLQPIHILWINLVTDSLPALALAVEPADEDTMRRPPRPPQEGVLAGGLWQHALWVGMVIAGCSLLVQAIALEFDWRNWQTMVFTVLTFSQLAHVLVARSETKTLAELGMFSNLPLVGSVGLVVGLQLLLIYVPVLNRIFDTAPLSLQQMALCIGLSLVGTAAVEGEKLVKQALSGKRQPQQARRPRR